MCVGVISGAHGVRGLVKVQSFTDPPEALGLYKDVGDEAGRPLGLELLVPVKGQFLGRVVGIADRDAAERARGTRLFVSRAHLPEAADGEFYHADLIGMEARSSAGEILGIVKSVENFGASDILDIKGTGRRDFMVPFTDAFVPIVDAENCFLVISEFEETK